MNRQPFEETAMKTLPILAAALLAAACAHEPVQVAQADCKVAPITTASAAGRYREVSPIEKRYAEMQLANSDYRMRQLRERGMAQNNVEDALRECNR